MLLSMQGRKSGETITIPVSYLREGNEVLCASDTRWWRNLAGGAEVGMFIQGQSYTGRAEIVEGHAEIEAGFRRLRPSTYERALRTGAVLVRIELD